MLEGIDRHRHKKEFLDIFRSKCIAVWIYRQTVEFSNVFPFWSGGFEISIFYLLQDD
jgi:hypothetical protein